MTVLRCPECEKLVHLKPLFGTMHFCLTDQERAEKMIRMRLAERGEIYPDEDRVRRATDYLLAKWEAR